MATFQVQVEALTGQSIGSGNAPSTAELTQFLNDGVIDVTNRAIQINPMESMLFQTESDEKTANNSYTVKGKILSIVRENGTDGGWEKCDPVPNDLEGRVQDSESLDYATKFNPVYLIRDNGKISVYPAPGSSNDGFKVYYISNHPENDQDAGALVHTSYDIRNFPYERVYLVVLYSAIRSINNELSKMTLPPDLTNPVFEVVNTPLPTYTEPSSYVSPVAPIGVDVDFSDLGSIATYSAPALVAPNLPIIDAMTLPVAPTAPSITAATLNENNIVPPTYVPPSMNIPDWGDTNTWITTEEDPEMLAARVTEIEGKVKEYQGRIQNAVAEFNRDAEVLKKDLQVSITNASFDDENEKRKIQLYASDLQLYQTNVTKEVQKWTLEEWGPKWEEFQLTWQSKLQEYATDISNETSRVKASLDEYTAEAQKALTSYQAETGNDISIFQQEVQESTAKFNADLTKNSTDFQNNLQKYQSEVQKVSAGNQEKLTLFSAEVQDYTARIQKYRTDYEWMQGRYIMLKKDYDDAFMIAGSQRKQQGER